MLAEKLVVAHPTFPIIASAWSNPASVLITDGEGEILTIIKDPNIGVSTGKESASITSLSWHPIIRLLIIGWSTGRMSTWQMQNVNELGVVNGNGVNNDMSSIINGNNNLIDPLAGGSAFGVKIVNAASLQLAAKAAVM